MVRMEIEARRTGAASSSRARHVPAPRLASSAPVQPKHPPCRVCECIQQRTDGAAESSFLLTWSALLNCSSGSRLAGAANYSCCSLLRILTSKSYSLKLPDLALASLRQNHTSTLLLYTSAVLKRHTAKGQGTVFVACFCADGQDRQDRIKAN